MAASSDIERRVGDYYSGKVREHGPTPSGVDWNSGESQETRFAQLLRAADGLPAPLAINDWGCGYGALVEYLDARGMPFRYHGYDISASMIEHARTRFAGRDDCTFGTDEAVVPEADVTVASGIFNVLAGSAAGEWAAYVRRTVARMAEVSRRGLAYNMLTDYSDPERMEERLHYGDSRSEFDWCKRNLSRHVALLHDYGLWEFTIVVRFQEDVA